VALVVATALAPTAAVAATAWFEADLRTALAGAAKVSVEAGSLPEIDAVAIGGRLVALTAPLLTAVAVTAIVVTLAQTGGSVLLGGRTERALLASPFRVNGPRSFAVLRAFLGCMAVAGIVVHVVASNVGDLARLAERPSYGARVAAGLAAQVALRAAMVGLALAGLDLLVTRAAWRRRLRMTRREVDRERREAEGDPRIAAARARATKEATDAAALGAVGAASIVVTGRAGAAVALCYDEGRDAAPRVVASGEGALGARVAEAGAYAGVPRVDDPDLASALRAVDVGDAIPPALYDPIAELLG